LAKKLIYVSSFDARNQLDSRVQDFFIAAEFKCHQYSDLWHQLQQKKYAQVRIRSSSNISRGSLAEPSLIRSQVDEDFDSFYVFVPTWLATDKIQVEKLLGVSCSQPRSKEDSKKTSKDLKQPPFMILLPKRNSSSQHLVWTGDTVLIRANESIQLALNSTELSSLHLVVNSADHWRTAVDLFLEHVASNNNVQLSTKLARDEDIRQTFDQLPVRIAA
jgi:hypothetical protein